MSTEVGHAGLRERKKLTTRHLLAQAALRLAMERGLEQVRVEDIAAAVDVSPRTFNNYFSSKEEAIVSIGVARVERIGAALRARPVGESLADALTQAFAEQYAGAGRHDQEWAARVRLITSSPALRGEYLKTLVASERPLAEAIAERTGTDVEHDLYPRVLAAAVSGAVRVATNYWLDSGAGLSLAGLLRQAIAQIVVAEPQSTDK